MELSSQEKSFIEKRSKLASIWQLAGSTMIAVIAGLCVWLFWSRPLLINPLFVVSQLKADAVPDSMLILMAAILPVSMLMCVFLLVVLVLIGFSVFSRDRKYISIIHRLTADQSEKSN